MFCVSLMQEAYFALIACLFSLCLSLHALKSAAAANSVCGGDDVGNRTREGDRGWLWWWLGRGGRVICQLSVTYPITGCLFSIVRTPVRPDGFDLSGSSSLAKTFVARTTVCTCARAGGKSVRVTAEPVWMCDLTNDLSLSPLSLSHSLSSKMRNYCRKSNLKLMQFGDYGYRQNKIRFCPY